MYAAEPGNSFISSVEHFMISRMGEYVTVSEITQEMRRFYTRIDEATVLSSISYHNRNRASGKETPRPYQIVRTKRPKGLDRSVVTPFVLVPLEYRDQVMADESWAASSIRRKTRNNFDVFENIFGHDGDIFKNLDLSQALKEVLGAPPKWLTDGEENLTPEPPVAVIPEPITEPLATADITPPTPSRYSQSPWTFTASEKETMRRIATLSRQHITKTTNYIALIDEYMIDRMGDFTHPEDIFEVLRGKGYPGTLRSLVTSIATRTSFQNNTRREKPAYQIVHPHRPRGLPAGTHCPLVLVPIEYVERVLQDESWAVSILQEKMSEQVAVATRLAQRPGVDGLPSEVEVRDFLSIVPHFGSETHVRFPESPWKFDDDEKERMKMAVQTAANLFNGSNMMKVDLALVEKMGEYVHPLDLFKTLYDQGVFRDYMRMRQAITVRNCELKSGKQKPMKWLIVRPKRPERLDKIYQTPYVFVPSNYPRLQEIIDDTSWARNVVAEHIAELDEVLLAVRDIRKILDAELEKISLDITSIADRAAIDIVEMQQRMEAFLAEFTDAQYHYGDLVDFTALDSTIVDYEAAEYRQANMLLGYEPGVEEVELELIPEPERVIKIVSDSILSNTQRASPGAGRSPDFQSTAQAATPVRDYKIHPISNAPREPRLFRKAKEDAPRWGNANRGQTLYEEPTESAPLIINDTVLNQSTLEASPLETRGDHFAQWVSRFKNWRSVERKLADLNLDEDVKKIERRKRMQDPMYYLRDVLTFFYKHIDEELSESTITNSVTTIVTSQLKQVMEEHEFVRLTSFLRSIICEALKEAHDACFQLNFCVVGPAKNREKIDIEPFVLDKIEPREKSAMLPSYRFRCLPRNFQQPDFLTKRAVSRPDRG